MFAYTSWQAVEYVPLGPVSVEAKKPHRIHGPGRPLFVTMGNIFAVHLWLLRSGSSLQLIVCPLISMLESTKLFWVSLNLEVFPFLGGYSTFLSKVPIVPA